MEPISQTFDLLGSPRQEGLATDDQNAARKAGQEFEAFFAGFMVDLMIKKLPTDGVFSGGDAEKIYRSLLAHEYGKEIAKSSFLGISDMVERELLSEQKLNANEQNAHKLNAQEYSEIKPEINQEH